MSQDYKKASLKEIASAMAKYNNFVICGHINPDGDCVGSQTALACALEQQGNNVVCLLVNEEKLDETLDFLPLTDRFILAQSFVDSEDFINFKNDEYCFISVDVQSNRRIGKHAAQVKEAASLTIVVDHHQEEDLDSHLEFIDSKAASNTINIWHLCMQMNIKINKDIALCAYTGLVSDTNGFTNTNTDVRAFDAAKEMVQYNINPGMVAKNLFQRRSLASFVLQKNTLERLYINEDLRFALTYLIHEDFDGGKACKRDSDFIIDEIRTLDCVDVVCVLRQQKKGDKVHGSLRAKNQLDVSRVAKRFTGGGHKAAAGFTMDETDMAKAIELVKDAISNLTLGKI